MKKRILLAIYFVCVMAASWGLWRLLTALAAPQITEMGL